MPGLPSILLNDVQSQMLRLQRLQLLRPSGSRSLNRLLLGAPMLSILLVNRL